MLNMNQFNQRIIKILLFQVRRKIHRVGGKEKEKVEKGK
ncbi:hypothetical protein MTR67_048106 [Solanum verrucosum]|uniref:Uncharacterized protein n=1 Tax=Solanum verrucosum TaxID=315347 RepID=A0AAF0ZX22_SOLVR|nr:hypothetical protein MTR67_048106 [Solanum verrucosum]